MLNEISAASTFLSTHLSASVPPDQRSAFQASLQRQMTLKFDAHWNPTLPLAGNAYRAINISGGKPDPVLMNAADECGLGIDVLMSSFPEEYVLWVDPFSVTYRVGDHGYPTVIWEDRPQLERINAEAVTLGVAMSPSSRSSVVSSSSNGYRTSPVTRKASPPVIIRKPSPAPARPSTASISTERDRIPGGLAASQQPILVS